MNTPRTCLVTGANRGIGIEVARQLLDRGFVVYLGVRSAKAGDDAQQSLARAQSRALAIDVADADSIRQAAARLSAEIHHLDVLINNAGVLGPHDGSVLTVSPPLVERTFHTNALGPLMVTQALLPLLLKAPSPRVVNVSSGGGSLAQMTHWCPAYSISKAALNAVTRQLAAALAGKVAVNSVCPGWVRTDMGGPNAPRNVEQGAAGIVWLADEAPANVTGKFWRDGMEIEW